MVPGAGLDSAPNLLPFPSPLEQEGSYWLEFRMLLTRHCWHLSAAVTLCPLLRRGCHCICVTHAWLVLRLCVTVSLVECDCEDLLGAQFPHLSNERVPHASEVVMLRVPVLRWG